MLGRGWRGRLLILEIGDTREGFEDPTLESRMYRRMNLNPVFKRLASVKENFSLRETPYPTGYVTVLALNVDTR